MKKTLLQFCVMATVAVGLVCFVGCTSGDSGAKKAEDATHTEQPAAQPAAATTDSTATQAADTTKHEGGH